MVGKSKSLDEWCEKEAHSFPRLSSTLKITVHDNVCNIAINNQNDMYPRYMGTFSIRIYNFLSSQVREGVGYQIVIASERMDKVHT